jgi:uncharacterized repeat protein (TIGR01451 family)
MHRSRRALLPIFALWLVVPSAALAADADLSIFINHNPGPAVGLEQFIFTIHVSNLGPAAATGIKVVSTLPPGTLMDIPGGGIGWDCGDSLEPVVTCTLPTLAAGANAFFLGISFIPPAQGGSFTHVATVSGNEADPVAANNTASDSAVVNPAPPVPFYTVNPCRIVDTRGPVADTGGPALAANTKRDILLTGINAPPCGVPSDARAVAVNVTVVDPSASGDLRLYPAGTSLPNSSTINFAPDQVRANSAVVPLSSGLLSVQCDMLGGPTGTVHFILDVSGYFR